MEGSGMSSYPGEEGIVPNHPEKMVHPFLKALRHRSRAFAPILRYSKMKQGNRTQSIASAAVP
jgi:hypothetical protein